MARPYQLIAEELGRRIGSGMYGPDRPIPSERALEDEFSVHRATIRRALQALADSGQLSRMPGKRAFARPGVSASDKIALYAGGREEPHARSLMLDGMKQAIGVAGPRYEAFAEPGQPLDSLYACAKFANPSLAGVCLLPPTIVDAPRLRAVQRRVPIVLVDRMIPGFQSDFVGFDDFEAGYEAARHLYEVGHRKIAYVGGLVPTTAFDRSRGVETFCQDAGIEICWNFAAFASARNVQEPYIRAVYQASNGMWPTAAVCENDETAAWTISLLGRIGLKIPGDLALVGFGNAHVGLLDGLGLTTMAQPYREVGALALHYLAKRIAGSEADFAEERLRMTLIVRTSCGS